MRWFHCLVSISFLLTGCSSLQTRDSSSTHEAIAKLTIDPFIQSAVEESFREYQGTVIVMDVRNGDVLGMTSNPSKDKASPKFSLERWKQIESDPKDSFLVKAITEYHPGATFLPVVSLAALSSKTLVADDKLNCSGSFYLQNIEFKCWETQGHGMQTIEDATKMNCGVFFYQLGQKTGIEHMAAMAKSCGFGEATEISPTESKGIIPTPELKKRWRKNEEWTEGDTVNTAIGQGMVLVTPLQQAVFMSAVANGGNVYYPRLRVEIVDSNGKIQERTQAKRLHSRLGVSKEDLETVRRSLLAVVEDGTGKLAKLKGIKVAGKTGTTGITTLDGQKKARAWFCGFAPYDEPHYAFVIFVEDGFTGGSTAGPVAHDLMERIFKLN
jgi:penicillin-binding protein 2